MAFSADEFTFERLSWFHPKSRSQFLSERFFEEEKGDSHFDCIVILRITEGRRISRLTKFVLLKIQLTTLIINLDSKRICECMLFQKKYIQSFIIIWHIIFNVHNPLMNVSLGHSLRCKQELLFIALLQDTEFHIPCPLCTLLDSFNLCVQLAN